MLLLFATGGFICNVPTHGSHIWSAQWRKYLINFPNACLCFNKTKALFYMFLHFHVVVNILLLLWRVTCEIPVPTMEVFLLMVQSPLTRVAWSSSTCQNEQLLMENFNTPQLHCCVVWYTLDASFKERRNFVWHLCDRLLCDPLLTTTLAQV